jgi:hypothetical protein
MRIALLFLISIFSFQVPGLSANGIFTTKKDLRSDWKIFEDNKYKSLSSDYGDVSTLYFEINGDKYAGDYLKINAPYDYSVFINGQLASIGGTNFNIDSLVRVYSSVNLLIAIHSESISQEKLHTTIDTKIAQARASDETNDRPATFFRDFVIVASLVLLIMLIVVLRLNPKLASDYFSVTKIFSLRESDDSQIYTRISNSANILFYAFCSLILGFYLIVIFHFASTGYWLTNYFATTGFFSALSKWIGVSLFIFLIFILKIILVYVSSFLFGSRNMAGIHFFNWVRLQLIVFGGISIVLFVYFIARGQNPTFYFVLLKLMTWCLVGWTIIIFLKLNGRTGYSLFHLFSYICATEIIPLLVIISVLYN